MDEPDRIIEVLGMQPHPEGGHYVELWRGTEGADGRAIGTSIHFLLRAGERSHWHRVDADELWIYNAGAALTLSVAEDSSVTDRVLGPEVTAGQVAQARVPVGAWQAAESTGEFTLVSCVVVPGFEFDGFELAPPGWSPT